ncbi:MAG: PhnD/SsuA/transferrin family substrate-binding protein, partial [Acidimicrobiales bacterium]
MAVALLAAGCGEDDDAAAASQGTVRFIVTELKGLEELQREFGEFERVFEEHSGLELEFFPVTSRSAAAAALDADRADLVFTGPSEYVVLKERVGVTPVVAIERPGYSSCIYTTAAIGITSLTALEGERVAMEDVGSTSAHLGPSLMLADAGLDPESDVEVMLVGDAMHAALERGDVAAVGAGCHDYEEFVSEDDRDAFPVIERSEQLPADVIVAREGLDDETIQTIRSTFEDHWPELREAMLAGEENQKFADAELVAVP